MPRKFALKALMTVALLATPGMVAAANSPTATDPLAGLAGRWVSQAVMTSFSGPQSNFKCVVTYLPRKGAPGMKQNLRWDDGAGFKLHAATELIFQNGKVVGRWKDKINDIDGQVAGIVTPTGFDVKLTGRFFNARMAVDGQGCNQQVRVLPSKTDSFRELAASLKKC